MKKIILILGLMLLNVSCAKSVDEPQPNIRTETWTVSGAENCIDSICLNVVAHCPEGYACMQAAAIIDADQIIGFSYEAGKVYQIRVLITESKDSRLYKESYHLLEVLDVH